MTTTSDSAELAGDAKASPRPLRCAIYTRKSTEDGLNQPFNTLEAQREAAEAYILSQRHGGWTVVAERYDDGGYTGGNLDRPALQKLITDMERGRVDCVVVYKVDRLSRSLLDFAANGCLRAAWSESGFSHAAIEYDRFDGAVNLEHPLVVCTV